MLCMMSAVLTGQFVAGLVLHIAAGVTCVRLVVGAMHIDMDMHMECSYEHLPS